MSERGCNTCRYFEHNIMCVLGRGDICGDREGVYPHWTPKDENQVTEARVKTADEVNHPSHYTQGRIECIEAIKASMTKDQFIGYLKGNIIKYLWRLDNKAGNSRDDEKAAWYLKKLIETRKEESQ